MKNDTLVISKDAFVKINGKWQRTSRKADKHDIHGWALNRETMKLEGVHSDRGYAYGFRDRRGRKGNRRRPEINDIHV